jgi:hypothetical protein
MLKSVNRKWTHSKFPNRRRFDKHQSMMYAWFLDACILVQTCLILLWIGYHDLHFIVMLICLAAMVPRAQLRDMSICDMCLNVTMFFYIGATLYYSSLFLIPTIFNLLLTGSDGMADVCHLFLHLVSRNLFPISVIACLLWIFQGLCFLAYPSIATGVLTVTIGIVASIATALDDRYTSQVRPLHVGDVDADDDNDP